MGTGLDGKTDAEDGHDKCELVIDLETQPRYIPVSSILMAAVSPGGGRGKGAGSRMEARRGRLDHHITLI